MDLGQLYQERKEFWDNFEMKYRALHKDEDEDYAIPTFHYDWIRASYKKKRLQKSKTGAKNDGPQKDPKTLQQENLDASQKGSESTCLENCSSSLSYKSLDIKKDTGVKDNTIINTISIKRISKAQVCPTQVSTRNNEVLTNGHKNIVDDAPISAQCGTKNTVANDSQHLLYTGTTEDGKCLPSSHHFTTPSLTNSSMNNDTSEQHSASDGTAPVMQKAAIVSCPVATEAAQEIQLGSPRDQSQLDKNSTLFTKHKSDGDSPRRNMNGANKHSENITPEAVQSKAAQCTEVKHNSSNTVESRKSSKKYAGKEKILNTTVAHQQKKTCISATTSSSKSDKLVLQNPPKMVNKSNNGLPKISTKASTIRDISQNYLTPQSMHFTSGINQIQEEQPFGIIGKKEDIVGHSVSNLSSPANRRPAVATQIEDTAAGKSKKSKSLLHKNSTGFPQSPFTNNNYETVQKEKRIPFNLLEKPTYIPKFFTGELHLKDIATPSTEIAKEKLPLSQTTREHTLDGNKCPVKQEMPKGCAVFRTIGSKYSGPIADDDLWKLVKKSKYGCKTSSSKSDKLVLQNPPKMVNKSNNGLPKISTKSPAVRDISQNYLTPQSMHFTSDMNQIQEEQPFGIIGKEEDIVGHSVSNHSSPANRRPAVATQIEDTAAGKSKKSKSLLHTNTTGFPQSPFTNNNYETVQKEKRNPFNLLAKPTYIPKFFTGELHLKDIATPSTEIAKEKQPLSQTTREHTLDGNKCPVKQEMPKGCAVFRTIGSKYSGPIADDDLWKLVKKSKYGCKTSSSKSDKLVLQNPPKMVNKSNNGLPKISTKSPTVRDISQNYLTPQSMHFTSDMNQIQEEQPFGIIGKKEDIVGHSVSNHSSPANRRPAVATQIEDTAAGKSKKSKSLLHTNSTGFPQSPFTNNNYETVQKEKRIPFNLLEKPTYIPKFFTGELHLKDIATPSTEIAKEKLPLSQTTKEHKLDGNKCILEQEMPKGWAVFRTIGSKYSGPIADDDLRKLVKKKEIQI